MVFDSGPLTFNSGALLASLSPRSLSSLTYILDLHPQTAKENKVITHTTQLSIKLISNMPIVLAKAASLKGILLA